MTDPIETPTEKKRYLDPEVKKKWVEDLRSGKFTQGSGSLRYQGAQSFTGATFYCCLGVLAEGLGCLTAKNAFTGNGQKSFGPLPTEVRQSYNWGSQSWLSSTSTGYAILPSQVQLALADLNDRGITFAEIADYLEKNEEI